VLPPPLLGRERERETIEGLLRKVGVRGGSLLVRGEPGMGKTVLLDWAGSRAEELGLGVLSTAGVPSEGHMAFAGLHRLLRPHLAGIGDLPGPQQTALSLAFGLEADRQGNGEPSPAPDIFLIALATLDLLAEAAASSPLLLIVEDAHWLDTASCDVLAFVARRLELEPIVLLISVREGNVSRLEEAQLAELALDGLDDADAETLLDQHAPAITPEARKRLLETAAGNPLALVELPRAAGLSSFDDSFGLTPLPITERLERAFSDQLKPLPDVTRRLLLVAALDEGGGLNEQLEAAAAVERRPVTTSALAPAEAAGLISLHEAGVRFRHPLVRAAVASAEPMSVRQAAHGALADAHATDVERSVWHRAASRSGPDDEVASELEEAAQRATRRGAAAIAAAALERAAQLSATPSRRGTLLVRGSRAGVRARPFPARCLPDGTGEVARTRA
jgi:AAA ATPase domain